MKVNKGILLIGVILGLITVFFLNSYINNLSQDQELVTTQYLDVVVAVNTIPDHVVITEEMVALAPVPEDGVHPDALTSLDSAVGGISRSEIINGEQVLAGRIASDDIESTFSYKIPDTMRAITIPINAVSGVANHIRVGDKVDILVSYYIDLDEEADDEEEETESSSELTTFTQFQNIEVLALGQVTSSSSQEDGTSQESSNITILVNPEQAEVVAYAYLSGNIHLSLRNPVDDQINDLEYFNITNFESFRQR